MTTTKAAKNKTGQTTQSKTATVGSPSTQSALGSAKGLSPGEQGSPRALLFEAVQATCQSPYSHYGYALALAGLAGKARSEAKQGVLLPEAVDSAGLLTLLRKAFERCLGTLLVETSDLPQSEEPMNYRFVPSEQIAADPSLVLKAKKGAPMARSVSVLSTTFKDPVSSVLEAQKLLAELETGETTGGKGGKKLWSTSVLRRSYAPWTSKVLRTSSVAAPAATVLEVLCCVLTTLTPYKMAVSSEDGNQGILPNWDTGDLVSYILLLREYLNAQPSTLMQSLPSNGGKPGQYRLPRAFHRNVDLVLPEVKASHALTLLAALGDLARGSAEAEALLEVAASRPLYVTGGDRCSVISFQRPVVSLARDGQLTEACRALLLDTYVVNNGLVRAPLATVPLWNDPRATRVALDFLEKFDRTTYYRLLALRPLFGDSNTALLERYWEMQTGGNKPILTPEQYASGRGIGDWLSRNIYLAAKFAAGAEPRKVDPGSPRYARYKLESAKYWDAVHSGQMKKTQQIITSINGAQTVSDLFARLALYGSRIQNDMMPSEADPYIQAAFDNQVSLAELKHQLTGFLLMPTRTRRVSPPPPPAQVSAPAEDPT